MRVNGWPPELSGRGYVDHWRQRDRHHVRGADPSERLPESRCNAAVLINAELIGVPRELADEVARRLENRGIERAQVAIRATHTHTGPNLAGVLPFIFSAAATDRPAGCGRAVHQQTGGQVRARRCGSLDGPSGRGGRLGAGTRRARGEPAFTDIANSVFDALLSLDLDDLDAGPRAGGRLNPPSW